MPELDEPFAERIERLKHELVLALQWNRPSILLAVYSSEFVRADAEAALTTWLREQGQIAAQVQVTGPDDPTADVPRLFQQQPDRERTVFFVSGLGRGAPTTWNSLNFRREYLVEGQIRAVFWLTEGEAAQLPIQAPDFWVFRHRAVEFIEPPEMGRAVQQAREMVWEGVDRRQAPMERRGRIVFRERLLSELADAPETAVARAELHYTLGWLYYWEREYRIALECFQAASNLAAQLENMTLLSWSFNGLGNAYNSSLGQHEEAISAYEHAIKLNPSFAYPHNGLGYVYHDLGQHKKAIAAYQRAIELDPNYANPHNGLGNVYRALGQHKEAIAAYQHAIELDPNFAYPHNGLGNTYSNLNQHEEAIAAYQRAIELNPNYANPHNGLGNVYRALSQREEAIAAYQRAIELNPNRVYPHYNWALLEAVRGNIDAALEHLADAVTLNPRWKEYARNNEGFETLRDDPRFQELTKTTPNGEKTND